MLSSTLFPNTHRNSMFEMMCPQLPWRNIDVIGVRTLIASSSTTHDTPGAIGTPDPSGAAPVSSPGTIPRLHTLAMSISAFRPAPCNRNHEATHNPTINHVTIGR